MSDARTAATAPEDVSRSPIPFLVKLVLRAFPGRVAGMAATAALAQCLTAGEPYALKLLIDSATAARMPSIDSHRMMSPSGALIILVGLLIAAAVLERLYQRIAAATSPNLRARVQLDLYSWVLGHGPNFFQHSGAGATDNRIRLAANAATWLVEALCYDTVRIVVLIATSFLLLLGRSLSFGAALLAWAVAYVAVAAYAARRSAYLAERINASSADSAGAAVDALGKSELIRASSAAEREKARFASFAAAERDRTFELRLFVTRVRLVQDVAVLLLAASLGYFALRMCLQGRLSVGDLALVVASSLQVGNALKSLSQQMLTFFNGVGAIRESLGVLVQPHEIADMPGARPLVVRAGAIRFDGISFGFPGQAPILQHIDLDIRPREKIAFVGMSGAGKTTLVRLLRREYRPTLGDIQIDGQSIASATFESVNAAIAEVSQESMILARSIEANIRYAAPAASDAAMRQSAAMARAEEFIMAKQHGYSELLGAGGSGLSGGERQRLSIARAILKDAPILILDEASAALDAVNERLVEEALESLSERRTVIVIAHKLALLARVDRIIVIKDGRIAEDGRHAELVDADGLYAAAWRYQKDGYLQGGEVDGEASAA